MWYPLTLLFVTLATCSEYTGIQNYTDDFARNIMFPLSAAVYTYSTKCVNSKVDNKSEITGYTVDCGNQMKCSIFVAVLHSHNAVALAFSARFLREMNYQQELTEILNELKEVKSGRVSKYFYDAFKKLPQDAFLNYFGEKSEYKDYEVWITGYSHGGALATLAAAHFVANYPQKILKLVTFGQPMVAGAVYARYLTLKLKYGYHVVREKDLMPFIPVRMDYYPIGQKVYYNLSMAPDQFILCKGQKDPRCGSRKNSSLTNHYQYFGENTNKYSRRVHMDVQHLILQN
ncbi:hypothetical protein RB195_008608 [Necator americanus]|uniref:Fungal lipase-type domain-containing protein n=1 Tax=Necator americanus TaxID=51031 RepID=A0ABR1CPG0_NECAM